jgi:hypothetical protein
LPALFPPQLLLSTHLASTASHCIHSSKNSIDFPSNMSPHCVLSLSINGTNSHPSVDPETLVISIPFPTPSTSNLPVLPCWSHLQIMPQTHLASFSTAITQDKPTAISGLSHTLPLQTHLTRLQKWTFKKKKLIASRLLSTIIYSHSSLYYY